MTELRYIPLFSIILFFVYATPVANDFPATEQEEYATCLAKSSSAWASNCGMCINSSKSYRINLKNVCDEKLDVRLAVQERSMQWKTYNLNNMAPGDTISGYACEGTGKYVFWTRKAGDNTIIFPTEAEIEQEFSRKK
jgi:hypothetical protein